MLERLRLAHEESHNRHPAAHPGILAEAAGSEPWHLGQRVFKANNRRIAPAEGLTAKHGIARVRDRLPTAALMSLGKHGVCKMRFLVLAVASLAALPVGAIAQTCQQIGQFTYCDNGTTAQQIGPFTYINPGSTPGQPSPPQKVCQQIGQFTYCN